MNKLTPNDSYVIYKRGSRLRIDLTFIGWKNLKNQRGDLSIIFRGDEQSVFIVDREENSVREVNGELTP